MSAATRISLRHLRSLEAGEYSLLPGGMYNRAFLRTYCEYLSIDPAEAISRYEAETAPPKEKPAKPKPQISLTDSSLKVPPLVLWSVMLLFSATGLYLSRNWISETFSPYFSHRRPPEIAGTGAPAAPTASKPAPAPSQASNAPVPPAPEGRPSSSTEASLVPVPPGTIRLEFEVLQECWVSVTRDGSRVLVKILQPGDDQSFSATDRFFVVLGNAGGVRLKINGQAVKPLGKEGEVVKVLINEQSIKDLVARTSG
jgi:cytoskeleton protein RodZ